MPAIKKWYNDWPIKRKLDAIILIGLMMLSGTCMMGLQITNRSSRQLLYENLASSLLYSAKELQSSLRAMEAISFQAATDMAVQKHLALLKEDPENPIIKSSAFRQLNTSLLGYYDQQDSINFIALTSDALHVETDFARVNKMPKAFRQRMNAAALKADGRAVWIYDATVSDSLCVVRSVKRISPYRLDDLGVVAINVHMNKLVKESADFTHRFGKNRYMLFDGENVLYETNDFSEKLRRRAKQVSDNGYGIIKADGHRYFAVAGTVPGYGWQYVNLALYDDIYKAMAGSLLLYAAMLAAGAGLTILLCHRLVDRLTVHITSLIEKMQTFSQDNDKVPAAAYDYSERKDELGMLHSQFDAMASKIISLIQTDYTNRLLVKDAQLKALEAQIDPHFLYNVLQNISWNAKISGNEKIMEMVDTLGKMLRITLSKEDGSFTIGKEAEFVRSYMTIQQYRFDGQLKFYMDIPSEMLGIRIPKLTIQPLVENAIRYAMEESDETCEIRVEGTITDKEILISVSNSGTKFPEDLLGKLEQKQIEPNGFGIGLLNIQKRLQLFRGKKYDLTLLNQNHRAVVQIHIACGKAWEEGMRDVENDDR